MLTNEERAAFINAQTAMMKIEERILEAENIERELQGYSPANGPEQWADFQKKWEKILGHNEIMKFFNDGH